jgi:hypothetical protein
MPASDDEIERAKDEIEALRVEVRQLLADELGGAPDDYRAGPAGDTEDSDE